MAESCYLLIDPPGNGAVNVATAKARARNGSHSPRERGHARLSLDGRMALLHGSFEEADLAWLLGRGWARALSHEEALALVAGPEWEEEDL